MRGEIGRVGDRRSRLAAACAALLGVGGSAVAAEFELGDWKGSVTTTVTLGTQVRALSQDTELLFRTNAAAQGKAGGNPVGGQNEDDGNLNFQRGDQVSTVAKAYSEIKLKREATELVLAAKTWYDYTLREQGRDWGNLPSGYRAGEPLSDHGYDRLARFSGIALMNAYVDQKFAAGSQAFAVRLGNQTLQQWGERSSLGGGLSAVNPVDINAQRRPGAIAAEGAIPVPQIVGRWQFAPDHSVEAFYQFLFRRSELPGCGTFFSGSDYVPEGCAGVFPGTATTDGAKYDVRNYLKRAGTEDPSNAGQFGVAYRWKLEPLGGSLGVYFAQYHNHLPNVSVIKSTRNGAAYVAGDPDGQNALYRTEYVDNVHVWGLSLDGKLAGNNLYGEFTYRPNQPVGFNGSDMLNAFLSNTAATPLRQDATDTRPGAVFRGYERRRMFQLQLGASRPFAGALGSEVVTLAGELGYRYLPGLPDVTQRRYGRSTTFGLGPVNGTCLAGATSAMCSNDGYVTSSAYGYRLRASARYPAAFAGIDLIPTVSFAHDLKGWTHDGVFNEGRKILGLSLRGEYQKKYFAELGYVSMPGHGGDYDNLRDRDYYSLAMGTSF